MEAQGNYCKEHQGNGSHYDPKNCTVCKLRKVLETIRDSYDLGLEDAPEASKRIREYAGDALRAIFKKPIVSDHCESYALREAEKTIQRLKEVLTSLVGSSDRSELVKMFEAIEAFPVRLQDKEKLLNAIRTLLDLVQD